MSEVKNMFGYKTQKHKKQKILEKIGDLPTTFDSRAQWPEWFSSIREQGLCTAAWSMALA